MIKAKIGVVLCILSGLAAAALFFFIFNTFGGSGEYGFDWMPKLRFCGLYYSLQVMLDVILLNFIFLRAYIKRKEYAFRIKPNLLEKSVASRFTELVLMECYVALNVFFAYHMHEIDLDEFYIPMMYVKGVFFIALYQLQAISSFIKRKLWMRLLAIAGIAVLVYVVYEALLQPLKNNPLDDAAQWLDYLLFSYFAYIGKDWPETNYWITVAGVLVVECLLPTIRLIGLALYNTEYKLPKKYRESGR